MATRFYVHESASSGISVSPSATDWAHNGLFVNRRLDTTPDAVSNAILSVAYDASLHAVDQNALIVAAVSGPLVAQTIAAQTIKFAIQASETRASNNLFLTWKVYLVTNSGAVVPGGTILDVRRDGLEINVSTLQNRTDSATTTSVSASLGNRIVIELGIGGLPAAVNGGHNGSIQIGEADTVDLPENDTSTGGARSWIEFANTLSFATPTSRVSEDSIEVLYGAGETRVSEDSLEVLWDYGGGRLSQDSIEVLYADLTGGESRASQDMLEVLYGGDEGGRVSQDMLEVLYDEIPITTPKSLLSQDSFEILWEEPPPPEAPDQTYIPDGQVSSSRLALGQVAAAGAIEGQITSARAVLGDVANV